MGATPELASAASADAEGDSAQRYAQRLLSDLGRAEQPHLPAIHPAIRAAHCGLHWLTGPAHGAPRVCPVALASAADGTLAALASMPGGDALQGLDAAALLTERAALMGLQRQGSHSPAGACRLLACRDGTLAVHLARDHDWALLPAWLESEAMESWDELAVALADREQSWLLERACWLGLAVAAMVPPRNGVHWFETTVASAPLPPPRVARPLVVDLSSLWAGPLCSHLLQLLGAEVIKIESLGRPDGARQGHAAFFDRLNAGKASVALDFQNPQGREQLRALLRRADIVIEAARPRGLQQLGIDAQAMVAEQAGKTWISITGYGRQGENALRVAFGDDAAMAAGLGWIMQAAYGEATFVGDAIADPLTGLHAALAAWAGWLRGGGGLCALSLRDVVGHVIAADGPGQDWHARAGDWQEVLRTQGVAPMPPTWRRPTASAPALGADTQRVLAQRLRPC